MKYEEITDIFFLLDFCTEFAKYFDQKTRFKRQRRRKKIRINFVAKPYSLS